VPTDYFPPIQRAVQGLSPNTLETRRALYEKARAALLKQLRAADPALTESQITKERLLLEDAIRRIETDMLRPETAERVLGTGRPAMPAIAATPSSEGQGAADDLVDEATYEASPAPARAAASEEARRTERRPLAPRRREVQEGGGKRFVILGVLAAMVIGGGAAAVMFLPGREDSATLQPAAPDTPAETPKPAATSGKNDERLGDPAKPATPPAAPVAQPDKPAEVASNPVEPQPPGAPTAPTQPKPLVPPSSEAAVAQKATLLDEQPDQQAKFYEGTTTWRTQSVSGGSNAVLETAIVGEVEIPERKLKVTLTLRRNTDPALPATHTLQIQFAVPSDFPSGGVQDIANVLPKATPQQPGVPLTGGKVKVTNGVFLIGLQDGPQDKGRNLQLLRERGWFDVPLVYDNGRRAILTLEKGVPGERVFEEAFASWNATATGNP